MKKNEYTYLYTIKNLNKDKDLRIYFLDYLRIICSFFVVLIHVSGIYYDSSLINSYTWKISYYYNGLSRFSVPNFFMISGALLLNRDLSYNIIFNKYIKNIFVHLILWSIIYSLFNVNFWTLNIKAKFFEIIKGHYHLWYLYTIIGIYITIPLFSEISKNAHLFKDFLFLYFIILFIIPNYIYLFSYYSNYIFELLTYLNSSIHLNILSVYHFYFIIGHYLYKKNIEKKIRVIIYILGFISFIFTTIITYNFAIIKNKKINHYNCNYFNIFFSSLSIFLFFKNNNNFLKINEKQNRIILYTSKLTFGIYLIHPLIIEAIVINLYLFDLSINKFFLIPLLTIFIFLLSLSCSIIIKKIHLIGKYLI